jgi:hypothetical protein
MARFFGCSEQPVCRAKVRNGGLGLGVFHQFEAIAEGIEDMDTAETVEGGVGPDGDASSFAGGEDCLESFSYERRMGTLGRSEIGLETEMKIHGAGNKPDAFSLGHLRRLFDLREAKDSQVKGSGAAFARHRNGDLHMIDAEDSHGRTLSSLFCTARLNLADCTA